MPLDAGQANRVELLIPGMTCAGCMQRIEACLSAIPGVSSARANLTTHRVSVDIDQSRAGADDLVGSLAAIGYDARPFDLALHGAAQADQTGRELLMRIGVAGFAAMNVMLLSISVWSGADAATRDLLHWVSALIALPAMVYAGLPFYRSAASALAAGRLNMDVPISLAIALAAIGSLIETSKSGAHAYFDAGIMLIFFPSDRALSRTHNPVPRAFGGSGTGRADRPRCHASACRRNALSVSSRRPSDRHDDRDRAG